MKLSLEENGIKRLAIRLADLAVLKRRSRRWFNLRRPTKIAHERDPAASTGVARSRVASVMAATSEQLKVLLLSADFEVRGSSSYTLCLAEHLLEFGVSPTVVCPNADMVPIDRRKKLNIVTVPSFDIPVWGRLVLRGLKSELEADPPQLIHVQSRSVLSAGTFLARRLCVPFLLTVHDYLQPRERLRFDREWGRRIIAVSESVKTELLSRTHLPDDLLTVIHSGVDDVQRCPMLPVLDPGHKPVIGMASPLESAKGVPYFLGAARRVIEAGRDVEFLIAGAGPEEPQLRRLAERLSVQKHVTFAPNVFDFSTSISAMDIFCLPALRQGLGTVMFQAMIHGKPVIATGVGGVHSVVNDGENALVVPPSDSGALAARMLELLDDPERARKIGERGKRTVEEQFGPGQMLEQTVDAYYNAAAKPRPEPVRV